MSGLDACSEDIIGDYKWPLTDLIPGSFKVLLNCPCKSLKSDDLQFTRASRVCGGNFTAGAAWQIPDITACKFDAYTQMICNSSQVRLYDRPNTSHNVLLCLCCMYFFVILG